MSVPFYVGNGLRPQVSKVLPTPLWKQKRFRTSEHYVPDPGLIDACNTALLLGQPLLLTGEPGTGKTQFAYSLAAELGVGEPLKFETKSTSTSGELFYTYDALKRFQDAQSRVTEKSALPYITYRALGIAILRTKNRDEVAGILPPDFEHNGKCRSIVLIDEIDKAPRDFPNDILNELEQMYFRVPELGDVKIDADPELYPVLVFTSNSEKDLPDAFLRRCVYYNIPFPNPERLKTIISRRLGLESEASNTFIRDALSLFERLRNPANGLRKRPSTAELLGWLVDLKTRSEGKENPLEQPELAVQTLSNLVKSADDQEKAQRIVNLWLQERKTGIVTGGMQPT